MDKKTRALNMEEKRKLEKMLMADIENAEQQYKTRSREKRDELIKTLEANPPAEARALFSLYNKSQKALDDAEAKIEALGWRISGYSEKSLSVREGAVTPTSLAHFDEKAETDRKNLSTLKRNYTLHLFAEGAEAKTLFDALTKEIKALAA